MTARAVRGQRLERGFAVTAVAAQQAVRSLQGKSRVRGVVERQRPLRLSVAAIAFGPVFPEVFIVGGVTTVTGGCRCLQLHAGQMALLALQLRVRFLQRKPGLAFVIEAGRVPLVLAVAARAVVAATAAVHVVRAMTANTVARRFVVYLINVARSALGAFVRALQQIVRRCFVIEGHLGPPRGHVTGGAVLAQPTKVTIVFQVTAHAGGRCVPILDVTFVAACARHKLMRVLERKVG